MQRERGYLVLIVFLHKLFDQTPRLDHLLHLLRLLVAITPRGLFAGMSIEGFPVRVLSERKGASMYKEGKNVGGGRGTRILPSRSKTFSYLVDEGVDVVDDLFLRLPDVCIRELLLRLLHILIRIHPSAHNVLLEWERKKGRWQGDGETVTFETFGLSSLLWRLSMQQHLFPFRSRKERKEGRLKGGKGERAR